MHRSAWRRLLSCCWSQRSFLRIRRLRLYRVKRRQVRLRTRLTLEVRVAASRRMSGVSAPEARAGAPARGTFRRVVHLYECLARVHVVGTKARHASNLAGFDLLLRRRLRRRRLFGFHCWLRLPSD